MRKGRSTGASALAEALEPWIVARLRGGAQTEQRPCTMGVGCEEAGVCYADAHGEPDRCGRKKSAAAVCAGPELAANWRPIESAPDDTRIICVWLGAPGRSEVDVACRFTDHHEGEPYWCSPTDRLERYTVPDLWQPFPTIADYELEAALSSTAAPADDRFPGGLTDAIAYADAMEEAAGGAYAALFGHEDDGSKTGTELIEAVIARLESRPAAPAPVAGDAVARDVLLPCPFCGDATPHAYYDEIRYVGYVACFNNFPRGPHCGHTVVVPFGPVHNSPEKAKAEARRLWNERAAALAQDRASQAGGVDTSTNEAWIARAESKLAATVGVSEVTRQLIERDAAGHQKYGVTLDRADLTHADWLQHMAEELLDAAGYALAAKREALAGHQHGGRGDG